MKRMPELDSLRAFAAVVVLFFHLDPRRYFPGWSGVDLFFVLSGYLITSIILKNGEKPGFYKNFYASRTLRIWPTYYLAVVSVVLGSRFLAESGSLASIPFILTFTQNITLYWGKQPPRAFPPLDHTWTLAIEEQFYLIWPALVVWAGRRRLVLVCCLTIAVALATRSGDSWFLPKLNERLLLGRCDGFALGGLLAIFLEPDGWMDRHRSQSSRIFATIIGVAIVYFAWGCCWDDRPLGFIGLPTPKYPAETIFMFSVLYAGIIGLFAVQSGSRWLKPFRFGPLVYLGQISYGLYLYHYIVYWVVDGCQVGPHPSVSKDWKTESIKLGASLAAAMISWHLIERPILRWKDRFRYRMDLKIQPIT